MFLLRFVRYLRPFRGRLAFAMSCMVIVSVLGTVNILMVIPFLDILLEQATGEGQATRIEAGLNEFGEFEQFEELGPEAAAQLAAESPAAATIGAERVAEADDGGFSIGNMVPEGLREWADGVVAGPKAAIAEKRDAVEQWYRAKSASEPYQLLLVLALTLLSLTAVKCVLEYATRYQLAYSFNLMTLRMKEDIYAIVLGQDYLFFTVTAPGYLISRINSDVNALRQIFNKIIRDGVQQPLNLVFFSVALVWISPQLSLVSLVLLPPVGLLIFYFARRLRKNTRKQKKKGDQLTSGMAESLYNIRLIKALGTEKLEVAKFVKRSRELLKYIMKKRMAKFASGPIMEFVGALAACGVLLLGGYMILGEGGFLGGTLEPAYFFGYLFLLTRFYRPMKSLSSATMTYQMARVSGERILEMMAMAPKVTEAEDARPFERLEHGIELRRVTMSYQEKEVLSDVSMEIPRGRVTAVVGESGSGKTTLANLIARLFDPDSGQVLIDGVDLREYKIDDLRGRMGIVSQQTTLFDDTIANNIAYGTPGKGRSEAERRAGIVEAARIANADGFIRELDGALGYKTRIGPGGAKLSGGQGQRIAIARAIYRDPQILIFDEATSALDSQSQAQVQEAINAVLASRTAFVISHRLSTIRHADRIYVLDAGRIAEAGTHEELMARRGKYFALYQSEGIEEIA